MSVRDYPHHTKIWDGTSTVDVENFDSIKSLAVVPGSHHTDRIGFVGTNITAKTGIMLVDLSDTTNWPHSNTGEVDLEHLLIEINPTSAYRGTIYFGFLDNVDGTNGDLHAVYSFGFAGRADPETIIIDLSTAWLHMSLEHFFGPAITDDITFQTDVNLIGPDGATSYPSGDGDVVMLVDRTAGAVDVSVSMAYHTDA